MRLPAPGHACTWEQSQEYIPCFLQQPALHKGFGMEGNCTRGHIWGCLLLSS